MLAKRPQPVRKYRRAHFLFFNFNFCRFFQCQIKTFKSNLFFSVCVLPWCSPANHFGFSSFGMPAYAADRQKQPKTWVQRTAAMRQIESPGGSIYLLKSYDENTFPSFRACFILVSSFRPINVFGKVSLESRMEQPLQPSFWKSRIGSPLATNQNPENNNLYKTTLSPFLNKTIGRLSSPQRRSNA